MKTIRTLAILALAANISLLSGKVSTLGKELSSLAQDIIADTIIYIPEYTPAPYRESAAELDNPYIGWYRIHAYLLSDDPDYDLTSILEQEYGPGLVLLQFNLRNYANAPVSDAGLRQLSRILDTWHSRGRQLIIRFLYDWDGRPQETEPESISQILEHMSQTAEIVNLHSDCVHILQGIYVGAWGEMHGSRYTNQEDMITLISHLFSVTDPSIFLAVRTPGQWRAIAEAFQEPMPGEEDFGTSFSSRLGLYNDGLLGSETDLGTYGETDPGPDAPAGEKRSRQSELAFQELLCNYVPNGGEVVIDNPYNDFHSAVRNLAAIHISYLNDAYDEAVLSKWRADSYHGESPFDGMNGYDYIAAHLGYRYVLKASGLTFPVDPGPVLSLLLENTGFCASCRDFDLTLHIKQTEGGGEYVLPVDADTRSWIPGRDILLEVPLEIHSLAPGEYELSLTLEDPRSGFQVYLANEGAREGNGCLIGSLAIREFPQ